MQSRLMIKARECIVLFLSVSFSKGKVLIGVDAGLNCTPIGVVCQHLLV